MMRTMITFYNYTECSKRWVGFSKCSVIFCESLLLCSVNTIFNIQHKIMILH